MTAALKAVVRELEELRARYREDAFGQVTAIGAALSKLLDTASGAAPEDLIRQVHSLAGTSGSFGLASLHRSAADLEEALLRWNECAGDARSAVLAARDRLLAAAAP